MFARPGAGLGAQRVGTRRGRRGPGQREEGGAFLCQGICAARRRLALVRSPPLALWGAGPPLQPQGAGAWTSGAERPAPGVLSPAEAPPFAPRSPIPAAFSPGSLLPWPRPRPRPRSPLGSALGALPVFQGGCPGGAAAAAAVAREGGGEPPASQALPASGEELAALREGGGLAPRPAGEEPFVPSQKFACRDRDSCGQGGRRGRGTRGAGENRSGCLSCSPRCGGCGPGTGGGGIGGAHSTRDSAARGTN